MKRILVVCTANLCRSPMACALIQQRLLAAKLADPVVVESAGVWATDGSSATSPAIAVMADLYAIDISHARSRQLTDRAIQEADIVLVMEERHRRHIFHRAPEALSRVVLFSELAGKHDDIPDPFGADRAAYVATAERLAQGLEAGWDTLERLVQKHASAASGAQLLAAA